MKRHTRHLWQHAVKTALRQVHTAPAWVDLETPSERCVRLDYCSGAQLSVCVPVYAFDLT